MRANKSPDTRRPVAVPDRGFDSGLPTLHELHPERRTRLFYPVSQASAQGRIPSRPMSTGVCKPGQAVGCTACLLVRLLDTFRTVPALPDGANEGRLATSTSASLIDGRCLQRAAGCRRNTITRFQRSTGSTGSTGSRGRQPCLLSDLT